MMGAYSIFADTRQLSHEEWLEARKTGIGGSDAGAIMGVNPYRGPFSVWADKAGYGSAIEDNEAMRQGRDLEEYVAKRFQEKTGKKVRREYGMLRKKDKPWMIADIDRRIRGEPCGLECKMSKDVYKKRWRDGQMPLEYYCQCLHYMSVTGWDTWYLCAVIALTDVLVYKITRGMAVEEEGVDHCISGAQDDIERLEEAEEALWRDFVIPGTPPPPDGLKATSEALARVYSDEGYTVDSDDEADRAILELIEAREDKRKAEARIRRAENEIKARMQEAGEMRSAYASVTWKEQKRRQISEKKLKEKYPMVDVGAIREDTQSRVFRVKTYEEDE